MRDHQRAVDLQHDDRAADPDLCRHRSRVGQDHHRIEAVDVVERVLGHPQIAKPERLGPRCATCFTSAMSIRSGERCGNEMPNAILSFRAMRSFSGLKEPLTPALSPQAGRGRAAALMPLAPLAGRGRARASAREGEGKAMSGCRHTFSISSICAPSGASMKATWRPLLTCSSMTCAPLLRSLAIALA